MYSSLLLRINPYFLFALKLNQLVITVLKLKELQTRLLTVETSTVS